MTVSLIAYALLPLLSTFAGGYAVYRWKRDLHPWLSLSGGILLGVAFLDLLPEAFEHSLKNNIQPITVGAAALIAIIAFHILDKFFAVHHHEHGHNEPDEHCENEKHQHTSSLLRTGGIIFHTFLDGVAIGAGFAVNEALGLTILTAVVLHDFSDGMSTVTILKNVKYKNPVIMRMLILNAVAPFLGVLVGFKATISETAIAIMLSVFAGFFISIALSELLPQAHADRTRRSGFALTILGIAIVILIRMLGLE